MENYGLLRTLIAAIVCIALIQCQKAKDTVIPKKEIIGDTITTIMINDTIGTLAIDALSDNNDSRKYVYISTFNMDGNLNKKSVDSFTKIFFYSNYFGTVGDPSYSSDTPYFEAHFFYLTDNININGIHKDAGNKIVNSAIVPIIDPKKPYAEIRFEEDSQRLLAKKGYNAHSISGDTIFPVKPKKIALYGTNMTLRGFYGGTAAQLREAIYDINNMRANRKMTIQNFKLFNRLNGLDQY